MAVCRQERENFNQTVARFKEDQQESQAMMAEELQNLNKLQVRLSLCSPTRPSLVGCGRAV